MSDSQLSIGPSALFKLGKQAKRRGLALRQPFSTVEQGNATVRVGVFRGTRKDTSRGVQDQQCVSPALLLLLLDESRSMVIGSLQLDFGDDIGGCCFCWPSAGGTPVMPSMPSASSSCWFLFIACTYCCCKWRWYTSTVAFSSCHTCRKSRPFTAQGSCRRRKLRNVPVARPRCSAAARRADAGATALRPRYCRRCSPGSRRRSLYDPTGRAT